MKKTYQINEYQSFTTNSINFDEGNFKTLPEKTFNELERFILSTKDNSADALDIMSISIKKGIGKIITAKNYIGVITLKDGTSIEILPKICSLKENHDNGEKEKQLILQMLKTLKKSPFKTLQNTSVETQKINLYEIFIKMFINEVFLIVKRGLKRNYKSIQSNEPCVKGKILFSEQLKHNTVHQEKCFCEYEEFNTNCAENRLLKSTLLYLFKQTESMKNKRDLKTLLNSFSEVDESVNFKSDFSKIIYDRNSRHYETALQWSEIFLAGKSFTSFSGSTVAAALLFPMEKLFESYIAVKFKEALKDTDYTVSIQDKSYHLFDNSSKYLLKPDIVIKNGKNVFILDTKWKLINKISDVNQSDMYQMYAYEKRYKAKSTVLLYPMSKDLTVDKKVDYMTDDNVDIKIRFIDLFNVDFKNIINELELAK